MTTSIPLRIQFFTTKLSTRKSKLISMSSWLQATGYDHFDTSAYSVFYYKTIDAEIKIDFDVILVASNRL